MICRYYLSCKV